MSTCIKTWVGSWLKRHHKARQWLWFIGLWIAGLVAVTVLTYPIKLLIKQFF